MHREKMGILWKRLVNRETISYVIFGVLTTLVDWAVYRIVRWPGYSVAFSSAVSWASAVLFAFITNKRFVFQSKALGMAPLAREFLSFVSCRAFTGLFTIVFMVAAVDGLGWNEWLGKAAVSAISLVMNYVFSKLFIFKKSEKRSRSAGSANPSR